MIGREILSDRSYDSLWKIDVVLRRHDWLKAETNKEIDIVVSGRREEENRKRKSKATSKHRSALVRIFQVQNFLTFFSILPSSLQS